VKKHTLTIATAGQAEAVNITDDVARIVSGMGDGLLVLHTPHTTAALLIAEDDAELRRDYLKAAESWLAGLRPFEHIRNGNPNTEAHVMSSVFGVNLTLTVIGGRLSLGKYQNLMLLELDGPKNREIWLTLLSAD
jgi:secondary thiamine-phosphate synthase enzyme